MVAKKATDEQILKLLEEANGIRAIVATKLGMNERTLLLRLKRLKDQGVVVPESTYHPGRQIVERGAFEFTPLPDDDVSIEELIEQRKRKFLLIYLLLATFLQSVLVRQKTLN